MPRNDTSTLRSPKGPGGRVAAGIFALLVSVLASVALADTVSREIGGDLFTGAPEAGLSAPRDLFAAAPSLSLTGVVAGDAHAAGFGVEIDAETAGDVYAMGGTVSVRGRTGGDLTATGGTLRTHATAITGGNARLSGGTVTVDGPVGGALVLAGGEVTLNAPVGGDAWISAGSIRFGPEARIGGALRYATAAPMEIPERVIDPARVSFDRLEADDLFGAGRDGWKMPPKPEVDLGPGAIAAGLGLTVGALAFVALLFLSFMPATVARLRKDVLARPGLAFFGGIVALSALIGLVPVLVLTLVGLPLLPFAILAVIVAWFLGYLLGAYAIGMGIARALGMAEDPHIAVRLCVVVVATLVAALLNVIPFIGWMANFAVLVLGLGAMFVAMMERVLPRLPRPDAG